MADTIEVTLTPETIEARPTSPTELIVTIRNTGSTVEQYQIELTGLSPEWYTLPQARIGLFPNDREEARITILPAQEVGMTGGAHSFTITVSAQADPMQSTSVTGTLRVAVAAALEAQLRPSRVTGRKARYAVLIRNNGNAAVDVDLDAYDSEEGCDFDVKPSMATVKPGRRATINIAARPLHPRLVGMEHSFDFRITVQPSLGTAVPLHGLFIYKPRFRSWRPLTRLLTLAVLIAAAVIAGPILLLQLRTAARQLYVQPNTSVGAVKLGATNPDSVMAALGNDATMTNHDTLITLPQKIGSLHARLRGGQVVAIETTSPAFKTPDGVHVGSPVAAVKKAFGAAITAVGQSPVTASSVGGSGAGSGSANTANALAGGTLVLAGKQTPDGKHALTYFDLNKNGTTVEAIRTGYYPWINPDHGGPTYVNSISATETWGLAGGPYVISGDVRIPAGVTLTIKPGVHVFFSGSNANLRVDGGTLSAVGTPDAPIIFTSIDDPQHGAVDTLKRPAPQPGDWGSIGTTAAGGSLQLDHTQVYYGGALPQTANAEIYVAGGGNASVSIRNSDIVAAKGYGLNAGAAPPGTVIQGDSFAADTYPLLIGGGISMDNSNLFTSPDDPPNKHMAVYVSPSATIAANGATVVWSLARVPFVLQAKDLVDSKGTLELGPDVILKGFDPQSRLSVLDATLIVAGERGHHAIMTSYLDDAHGGDTNADGSATTPHPGDWRGLILKGTTRAAIQRLTILYGGATNHPALGIQDHATADIQNAEVAFSATDGIKNMSDQPVAISHSAIHDNVGFGIDLGTGAQHRTTLAANMLTHNGTAGLGIANALPPTPVTGASPTPPPPTPILAGAVSTESATPVVPPAATSTATIPSPATIGPASTYTPTMQPTGVAAPSLTDTPAPGPSASTAPSATDTPTQATGDTPTSTPTITASTTLTPTDTLTVAPTSTATPSSTDTTTPSPTATETSSTDTPTQATGDTATASPTASNGAG